MSVECSSDLPHEREPAEEIWSSGWPQTPREFEALVDRVLDRLVRYAVRMLGSIDDAEDVVQEVLVRVYADRVKRKNVERVVPYLYRMVSNACLDRRRRERNRPAPIELARLEDIPDEGNEAHTQVEAIDELRWIEHHLSQLPTKQAEVIRLRVLDDLPLIDIAQIVGCSLSTAKSRLCYGLRKLRQVVPDPKEDAR